MKTSHVLASLLFGSLAAAAPVDRRALVTHTEVVVETVIVYTTVYDDEPVAEATTTPASSYEVPQQTTSAEVVPTTTATPSPAYTSPAYTSPAYTPPVEQTSSSVYVAPVVQEPSSTYTPVVVTPTPTPTPTSTAVPQPETTSVESVYSAPAAATSAAPSTTVEAEAESTSTGSASYGSTSESSGEVYSGDITIYHTEGGSGACGTPLKDTDFIVALAQPAWGASTYDVMTGAATNPWCGQKIKVNYNGKSVEATIMDMCPGCVGHDVDLSLAAWNALGMTELTRIQGTWSKID